MRLSAWRFLKQKQHQEFQETKPSMFRGIIKKPCGSGISVAAKGRTAIVFLSNMSIVHDLWRTSSGLVQYSSWSMELLHKTTLPTGWVLSTQSKIEKETQAVLWNKLTKKPWKFHEANRKQNSTSTSTSTSSSTSTSTSASNTSGVFPIRTRQDSNG